MAGYWKVLSAAVGLAAFIGLTGPAQASGCTNIGDSCNVTNVQVAFGTNGQGYSGVYYAGLIDFTISSWQGSATPQHVYMICDDFTDEVFIGSAYTYYLEDADVYLAPVAGGLSTIHEIAGLAFYALANAGNAVNAGDAQMAIWDLMYGGFNQNGHIAFLETQAAYYYSLMVQQGWTYAEFESIKGDCVAGAITFKDTPNCQNQGQLVLLGDGRIFLPEPGTLGLFGMALLALGGLGWMRSRRGFGIL